MAKKDIARVKMKNKFQINPEEITWACPDPTWEYAEVWHQLQQSKKELDALLINIQDIDSPTLESDKQLRVGIKTVKSRLEFVADILSD
jgi:hypothetical protein